MEGAQKRWRRLKQLDEVKTGSYKETKEDIRGTEIDGNSGGAWGLPSGRIPKEVEEVICVRVCAFCLTG